jgi:hypothetical protein
MANYAETTAQACLQNFIVTVFRCLDPSSITAKVIKLKKKRLPSIGSVMHACQRQSDKGCEFFEQANKPRGGLQDRQPLRQLFPTIGVVKELQGTLVAGMQLRHFTQAM